MVHDKELENMHLILLKNAKCTIYIRQKYKIQYSEIINNFQTIIS